MAVAASVSSTGEVHARVMEDVWDSGECIRLEIAGGRAYVTRTEALKLHSDLCACLEAVGCVPVEIAVSEGSEDAQ